MNLVTILIFACITGACASIQTVEHYHLIHHGMMSTKVKREWTIARAVVLGSLSLASWCLGLVPWWSALALFLGSWGAFSFIFRRGLNRAMTWDRHYLGSTAKTDVFFISLAFFFEEWKWPNAESIRVAHQSAYKHSAAHRATVNRAEKIMSAVELGVAAIAVIITLTIK